MGDLISRETAVAILRAKVDMAIGEVKNAASFFYHCANMIEKLPAVDAVPRDEYDSLLKRFQHLLESDFISSFAEVKPLTGTYKRDIAEADNVQPNFGAKIDGGDA